MKKIQILFLSFLFFSSISQEIFADECLNSSIENYILIGENTFSKDEDEKDKLLKSIKEQKDKLLKSIKEQKEFFNNPSLKDPFELIQNLNQKFIDLQNEKFSLSIQYVLKKFEEEQEKSDGNGENGSIKILNKIETQTGANIFIQNFLEKEVDGTKINENPKNIPVSVLQDSVYLDFLVFSCKLQELGSLKEFKGGALISEILTESKSTDFEKLEILEKQKIVIEKAILKYQSFINNREMYVALRGVILRLENLKKRFQDFASLIGFLPAKLVDFGYKSGN